MTCEGTITATFTWETSGPSDPPPTDVVIAEQGRATVGGGARPNAPATTVTCDNGLGFPLVSFIPPPSPGAPYYYYSKASNGTRYKLKSNPGPSFTITCSPSATLAGTGVVGPPSGGGGGQVGLSYQATASPLEIVLGGGIGPRDKKKFLIGQRVTATLATGGLTANSFDWSVSGGEPFKNWTADQWESVFTPLGTETGSQMDFYFRKAGFDGEKSTVSTPVHLIVPAGALPAAGLDVTLERECSVDKPFSSLSAFTGSVQGVPDALDPQGMKFLGIFRTLDADNLDPGIVWKGYVITPVGYGEGGGWNYTQLVTPHRVRQLFNGVMQKRAYNDVLALDTTFGYWPIDPDTYQANGIEEIQGDTPGVSFDFGSSWVGVNDSFITYTLYKPPGDGSCYVPLKNLKWFWHGEARLTLSTYWQISNQGGNWSFLEDFPSHPQWQSLATTSPPFSNWEDQ